MNMASKTKSSKKSFLLRLIIYIIVILFLLVPAILFFIYWEKLIISKVLKVVKLSPDSEGMTYWKNPPTIITRAYRLYDYGTNSIDLIKRNASATLNVQETRPYMYDINATKADIEWVNNDQDLKYSIHRIFTRQKDFDQTLLTAEGTFVDILRAIFRSQFSNIQELFFDMGGNDIFYQRPGIDELEGFTSSLFRAMQDKMTGPNVAKYGYVYRYNGSRSYNYTIRAGVEDKGRVLEFASENVPFQRNSSDYPFKMYDGLTFLPLLQTKKTINIFQPDFCRPIQLKFNKIVRMFNINVHEFIIRLVDLEQCTDNSETCNESDRLDISKCLSASMPSGTVYLSKPHFYGHNSSQFNINGFSPEREKHESMIYFEPYSGTPVKAHHRIQLNVNAFVDTFKYRGGEWRPSMNARVSKRILPLLWIDQEITLNTTALGQLQYVHRMVKILNIARFVALAVAIVIPIILIVAMELRSKSVAGKRRNGDPDFKKQPVLLRTRI